MSPVPAPDLAVARRVAEGVVDPELPMLTLADLGVLRAVAEEAGRVVVTVTPTYTGCPAMATIRADLQVALRRAGFAEVEVRTALAPPWSTDWITERGRRVLEEHGIAPPGPVTPAGADAGRPVDLVLGRRDSSPACPRCGSSRTREVSRFGATPCTSVHVCRACAEPFEGVKAL